MLLNPFIWKRQCENNPSWRLPCDRKEQLLARERHWIETAPNINSQIPGRTKKEYYTQKSVCDKCGLEIQNVKMRRHQSRSLCQAVAEMRPTKKEQKECEKWCESNQHKPTSEN